VTNPTNTVYATKRLIGRGFKDEQTQKEMKVRGVFIVLVSNHDASVIEMQQRLICSSWFIVVQLG
jgi:molecular chaperone DnaK (HSP70)